MATPRDATCTAPSGVVVAGGRFAAPAWAASIPLNTWTTIPGGSVFTTWAASGIPYADTAYNGTSPKRAIVDAFGDPAPGADEQWYYGGGHGDGTCNAVVKLDMRTMAWSLSGQPTDPARYPPSYRNGGTDQPGPLVYPSGAAGNGFFLPAELLPAPEDAAYTNPLTRASSHMYAAAAMRGSVAYYFYGTYAEFDTATQTWGGRGVDLAAQLITFRPQYNYVSLQQGTVAVYDEVTDRFYVTLNPGDAGGGWRNGMLVFNPTTRQIEKVIEAGAFGTILNSISIVRVGRKLYCFRKVGATGSRDMNSGFIFDLDLAHAEPAGLRGPGSVYSAFALQGDTTGSYFSESGGSNQETIPAWYDGTAIRRWNYNSTHRGNVLSVNLTPVSGSGTTGSPWMLQQTNIACANPPTDVAYAYRRTHFHQRSGCVVFVPRGSVAPVALRLA